MTLNMSDPLDRLYLETLPQRPTPPPFGHMSNGPTAAYAALVLERERWSLLALFGDEEAEVA